MNGTATTPSGEATMTLVTQPAQSSPPFNTRRNVAVVTVVTVLLLACWTRYFLRYPGSPSAATGHQRSDTLEKEVSAVPPIRAASEVARTKLPKPSPIIAYPNAEESLPPTVQPDEVMHTSSKIVPAKLRSPKPHFAEMRHSTKIHTAAVRRAPAGEIGRAIGTKSRMTAHNSKPTSRPAAPESASPGFGSEIRDSQLPPAAQENAPEPSSRTAQLNESPNKSRPAGLSRPASTNYNEEWRRFTPRRRSTPPDESWRRRYRGEPFHSKSENHRMGSSRPGGA